MHVVSTDRFINTADLTTMKFCLRKYDIGEEYIENDWDVSDDELMNSIHIVGIMGIEKLEEIVNMYLST